MLEQLSLFHRPRNGLCKMWIVPRRVESMFEAFAANATTTASPPSPYRGPAAANDQPQDQSFLSSRMQDAACIAFADSFREKADFSSPCRFRESVLSNAVITRLHCRSSAAQAVFRLMSKPSAGRRYAPSPSGWTRAATSRSQRLQGRSAKAHRGQSIILIDDVLTSGSTASYCAKALMKSGAARVDVFTLARAA